MTDQITKTIELRAPVERVWRALTDSAEFGAWFRVKLDTPFVIGQPTRGHVAYAGYEHIPFEVVTVAMERGRLFAFTWHPYAIDPKVDYSGEPPTRVEFRLRPAAEGTHLTITETGFDALPPHRRPDCLRVNDSGWAEQADNIRRHVEA